jgi:hypothetical protein
VTKDQIIADLADGRVISVPLAWSWRLSEATPVQRAKFRLIGGYGARNPLDAVGDGRLLVPQRDYRGNPCRPYRGNERGQQNHQHHAQWRRQKRQRVRDANAE